MNPDYSPYQRYLAGDYDTRYTREQARQALRLSRKEWRWLCKVCPPPVLLNKVNLDEWATHKLAGALIHNMRAGRPTPKLVLNTPEHNEPISLHDALRRLGRKSPAYSNAMLGKDSADNYALIGCNGLYVPLGNWAQANRWFLAKQKAA